MKHNTPKYLVLRPTNDESPISVTPPLRSLQIGVVSREPEPIKSETSPALRVSADCHPVPTARLRVETLKGGKGVILGLYRE